MMLSYASGDFHVHKSHIEAAALDSKVSVPTQPYSGHRRRYGRQIATLSLVIAAVFVAGSFQ
jgi:hypothetical protein